MAVPGVKKAVKLNSGALMPVLGFGTWQAEPGVVAKSVDLAVRQGFRHIDCATIYQNQDEIGLQFEKLFAEKVVDRKDLFITTKLWNTDHHPDQVEKACRLSLQQLKLEYLDLYLIHWPADWKHPGEYKDMGSFFPRNEEGGSHMAGVSLAQTWAAMESLVEKGLVKSIGVSNFSIEQLTELKKSWKIPPATNQVEAQPFCPNQNLAKAQKELAGIELTAYCPLGVGMGKDDGVIGNAVFKHPEIVAIAEKNKISSAMLCIQWGLDKGYIVLSKSTTESRIAENAAALVGSLSAETIAEVDALFEANKRRVCNPDFFNAKAGPFFSAETW